MRKRTVRLGEYATEIRFVTLREAAENLIAAPLAVFDANTVRLFEAASGERSVILPAGELSKNWVSVEAVLARALDLGLGRDGVIAGAGGGVVCDLTGFAASVYMRGTGLELYPTTLLAMTDAAVGGKTGIDYGGFKNIVGSFYPAGTVFIAAELLETLPEREFRSGLAEVIKHALLGNRKLFELLESSREDILARKDPALLEEMIYQSVGVKIGFVEEDFRESGRRAFLNFGHTFGHALESSYRFEGGISHGEAVAWGITAALRAGCVLGITDERYAKEAARLIEAYGFTLRPEYDPDELIRAMKKDKKMRSGKVRFIFQRGFGDTVSTELEEDILREVLSEAGGRSCH
jgi:3-dehydroquinate synthase